MDGMTEWKPYTPDEGATMIFDNDIRLGYHPDAELLELIADARN